MIGTRVRIRRHQSIGQHHWDRWGVIVAGPETQFGERRYQVRIELQGQETVTKIVWLPAKHLLVPKRPSATGA